MVSLGRHFVPNPVLSDIIPRGPAHRIPFSFHTRYDGLARRIILRSYVGGSLAETRHLYFSSRWQVLEERLESGGQLAATADRQFVWGLRYIDDLLLRDRDTNSNGTLNERLYALQDANWNVTAVADPTGAIAERYAYTPYGTPFFLSPTFTPRAASQYDFATLYTGRHFDAPTGLYYYRARYYQPGLGVFVGRDLIPYGRTANLYEYVGGNPIAWGDPAGHEAQYCGLYPGYMGIGSMGGAIKRWEREAAAAKAKELCANIDYCSAFCTRKGCTRELCEKSMTEFVMAVNDTWILGLGYWFGREWYFGWNTCSRWVSDLEKRLPENFGFDDPCIIVGGLKIHPLSDTGWARDHIVYSIRMCDDTRINADNGAWGGGDHIFVGRRPNANAVGATSDATN